MYKKITAKAQVPKGGKKLWILVGKDNFARVRRGLQLVEVKLCKFKRGDGPLHLNFRIVSRGLSVNCCGHFSNCLFFLLFNRLPFLSYKSLRPRR